MEAQPHQQFAILIYLACTIAFVGNHLGVLTSERESLNACGASIALQCECRAAVLIARRRRRLAAIIMTVARGDNECAQLQPRVSPA